MGGCGPDTIVLPTGYQDFIVYNGTTVNSTMIKT
jgi:hypothetical protein